MKCSREDLNIKFFKRASKWAYKSLCVTKDADIKYIAYSG
jgi:hypothetical protein